MLRNIEPSIQELRERVKIEWATCYPMKAFPENLKIEISNRLREVAGKVLYIRFQYTGLRQAAILRLSRRYHDRHGWGDELTLTIKHEIVHVAYPRAGHGRRFHSEIQRIGTERYCKRHEEVQIRTLYRCRACCHKFQSMNEETFCPKCDDLVEEIGKIEM